MPELHSHDIRIAIDAMGGDYGPPVTIPASVRALREHPSMFITFVGDEARIRTVLEQCADAAIQKRIAIVHTDEVVAMDDPVQVALRQKKKSSMRLAINLVKEKEVGACVSAGNTGALMAVSRFVLKTHPKIDRPAIITALPTVKGHVQVLDLGANVDSTAEHLVQFAQMGSVLSQAIDGLAAPRVALLNIGEEDIKGNELIKEAACRLSEVEGLNYIGYVEGDGIFQGHADVVVCDGFVGNVMLKTSEGVARMISEMIKRQINRNLLTRLSAAFAWPIWKALKKELDPGRYNGASLIGLNGIVIKSHGGTDETGFYTAVCLAAEEVKKNIPALIQEKL